jgi:hypothetical protein
MFDKVNAIKYDKDTKKHIDEINKILKEKE